MIYFDNNASTKPDQNALNAAVNEVSRYYGNPSSLHTLGLDARDSIEEARADLASSINAIPSEIVFTSGGTEANNIALNTNLGMLCSAVEHSSVYNNPSKVDEIRVNQDGELDLNDLEEKLKRTLAKKFVSVMLVNNETGTILDLSQSLTVLKEKYGFVLHIDAVAAYGKIDIDVKSLNADFLSLSGHKIGALKGIGALYVKKGSHANKIVYGGSQELGRRPGTENHIGICTFGYMAKKIKTAYYQERIEKAIKIRDFLEDKLKEVAQVNGSKQHRVWNTSNMFFPEITDRDDFLDRLSANGLCVSAGSACRSGEVNSRVLEAMYGKDNDVASKSIRFSLSADNTINEAEEAVKIIMQCLQS